jgi:hypothetical protein
MSNNSAVRFSETAVPADNGRNMTDRILNSAWWLTTMSMICLSAGLALYLGYRGLFDVLAASWVSGAVNMSIGTCATFVTITLCRLRDDLIYSGAQHGGRLRGQQS